MVPWLAALGVLVAAPFLVALLALCDVLAARGRRAAPEIERPLPEPDGVSVVIPSFNGQELLPGCLASLQKALAAWGGATEVIVVDDGSTDASVALLREQFPEVRVVVNPENLGFGKTCNRGAEAARYDLLLFLNNDMYVDLDFLAPLVQTVREPRVFAATAQIFFSDPAKRREETGLTYGRYSWGRLALAHSLPETEGVHFSVLWPGGGSMLVRRDRFRALGGFDPIYAPFYVEDLDLGMRSQRYGWTNVWVPESRVDHLHRGTVGRYYSEEAVRAIVARNLECLTLLYAGVPELAIHLARLAWDQISAARSGRGVLAEARALGRWPQVARRRLRDVPPGPGLQGLTQHLPRPV